MSDLYEAWKPLRNSLNKLDLNDSLGVIRAYSAWISLKNKPEMPGDIEVHTEFYTNVHLILPWDLEILAREILIVCEDQPLPGKTLRKWSEFANVYNKIRAIEENIAQNSLNQGNVLHEVTVRLTHRQFKYQTERPNFTSLMRYSKIFGNSELVPIVEKKIGLSPKKIFTIGTALWSQYTQLLGMRYPLDNLDIKSISKDDYDKFMAAFSRELSEMKKLLSDPSEHIFDDTFLYQYHSLYAYPIVFTKLDDLPTHVCPLPSLLYWRITSGLYYELCKEKGFDQAFGKSFETYVGDMLATSFMDTSVNYFPEEDNQGLNRCDWVIDQENDFMLIECKTKRLTMGARTTLVDDRELKVQLSILGDAIVQAYQSYEAYKNELYENPNYLYNPKKQPYVCVTTLEKWYIFGPQLASLDNIVRTKLKEKGLPAELIDEAPYIVASIDELEELAYLFTKESITEILGEHVQGRAKSGWELITYLNDRFKSELEDYKYVFWDDINEVFTIDMKVLRDKRKNQTL